MTMSLEEQLRCERDCARLCHDFCRTVDRREYDAFVALFAADGVFERAGQLSQGRDAIRRFLDARPADRVTRHVCGNVRIDMTGPDTATGSCSALMFQATAPEGTQPPLAASHPVVVDYADDYVRTAAGWKFRHRRTTVVFQP